MADAYPVTLCGILMDGATPDADGVLWGVESLEGWDSAPVEVQDGDRTGRHGSYAGPRLYRARDLTLNGIAHCPDAAAAFSVRNRLHVMPGSGDDGVLVRHEPVPTQLTVRVGDGPIRATMPLDIPHPYIKFSLSLKAHDPFKRAATANAAVAIAAGGTQALVNNGTAAADLLVTVTSPGTVELTVAGVTFRSGSLPSGAVIDTGASTVRSSGGADLSALVASPWRDPAVPSGGASAHQGGTAGLSVVVFDTYA